MPAGPPYIRPPATCHPDRPHQARGLCENCYASQWRKENRDKVNAQPNRNRPAECHPDRTVLAQGLCNTCYRQKWRSDPENLERERAYARKWARRSYQRRKLAIMVGK